MCEPFYHHPNFDPAFDAQVAAWVQLVYRKDWAALNEAQQAWYYVEFLETLED